MILLVEPSKNLAETVAQHLENNGARVFIANTAEKAIAAADENQPRFVIIELLMPRHNGLEFIYEFRSYEDWIQVPIIIYSHLSAEELGLTADLARDMNIVGHLYKPTTTLDQLKNIASRYIVHENESLLR